MSQPAAAEVTRPTGLTFQALHYGDRLQPVNPAGDVGLITLWSPLRAVNRKLAAAAPQALDDASSRVAVMANLYGDGLYAMFCNLLFNPQIRHLIAIGESLGLPTCEEIGAFLERGVEADELLGMPVMRVTGTARVFAAAPEFDAQRLRESLSFRYLGKLSGAGLGDELSACLQDLPRLGASGQRVRVAIERPEDTRERTYRPSLPGAHQVVRRRPLDCWEELVVRTLRFGRPVKLRSGTRLELLNVRALITEPAEEPAEQLGAYGFSLEGFRRYQARMFDAGLGEDAPYTYGNRLGGHFTLADGSTATLAAVAKLLRENPRTRNAFVSLWDTSRDLQTEADRPAGANPCLVTLFFRCQDGRLSLTAGYRSHNLLIAWLENVYGLMAIQRRVAAEAGMEAGPITVISHSLGIDPANSAFAGAQRLLERWKRDLDWDRERGKYSLREDPNGYFRVGVDEAGERIVAEHLVEGVVLKRYTGRSGEELSAEIAADMSVSLVSHAMWLGAQLARAEERLHGR
ncbi:MAG TPA: thymidylate synthase [Solirubrobacteraceae bacterium]|nr:thymidylate synthase [Solirubrobacteraceae bacterium]